VAPIDFEDRRARRNRVTRENLISNVNEIANDHKEFWRQPKFLFLHALKQLLRQWIIFCTVKAQDLKKRASN
jgi:hypothetical protein